MKSWQYQRFISFAMNRHSRGMSRQPATAIADGLALIFILLFLLLPTLGVAQPAEENPASGHFTRALTRLVQMIEPATNAVPATFVTQLKIVKAEGLPKDLSGQQFDLAWQAPDHLRLSGNHKATPFVLVRNGQELWVYAPGKKFGLVGDTNIALFATAPEKKSATVLAPIRLPLPAAQLALLPLLMELEGQPNDRVGNTACNVIRATAKLEARRVIQELPQGTIQLWIRDSDSLPLRLGYTEGKTEVQIELIEPHWVKAWPESKWKLPAGDGDQIEAVAQAHLLRFLNIVPAMLGQKPAHLGPSTGERRVVAREGNGRLEVIDGTRVLFVKGTPEEMGEQHGRLLRPSVRSVVDQILYGVGVGSSFPKGRWFFGEIESAEKRLLPFMNERYLREMDALACAAGVGREEMRLANFFPELFHCSGFALTGAATKDGGIYHGRILDYMAGVGLEPNSTVMVLQPDHGHAWVNISYAGFVGSVTAMNDQHISIGEMGGHGEGNWDGKPMAQLVREVMERAATLDEAIAIMRDSPRTCEYYYVISDGKTKQAVGIKATSKTFEVIRPGEAHPEIATPVKNAVILSGGDRFIELTRRVQAGWGQFGAHSARDLMTRPVSMKSNIQSVLFAPDTLDFWVANADGLNVASHSRYTHYNLEELLRPEKP